MSENPDDLGEAVAGRLAQGGVDTTDRFISVHEGGKASTDHDTRYSDPSDVPGQNYGIYAEAGDKMVILDVDDYDGEGEGDKAGLEAVRELLDEVPTFTQVSAHDGDHPIYRVLATDDGRLPAAVLKDRFGTSNPNPSWGEVRTSNQYVLGAGSQLDGCDKEWCDACADPDGGRYTIGERREVATISADLLVKTLSADPDLGDDDQTSLADARERGEDTASGGGEAAGEVTDILTQALDDSGDDRLRRLWRGRENDDRSEAECRLATKLAFWLGSGRTTSETKRLVGEVYDGQHTPDGWPAPRVEKWAERGEDYRDSVLEAVEHASEHYEAGDSVDDPRSWKEIVAENSDEFDSAGDVPDDLLAGDEQPAAADGGSRAVTAGRGTPDYASRLTQDALKIVAEVDEDESIDDLDNRAKAAAVWELCRRSSEVHVRVRRDNDSLWAYDDGVWRDGGERALRHAARRALGAPAYGSNVLVELKTQARADPVVEAEADEFGLEPGQLAVENGLLDLDDAADGGGDDALRQLRPDDLALTRLPVEFDHTAEFDEWQNYVEEWVEDGRADALQEFVGYCLHVGELPIHRVLLLVGGGANGKGTFLHVVRELLGEDNTSAIELQTLANERDARADFYGSLANIDDDLSARKLGKGIGMFKKLAAGDRVRARALYEDGFEYEATGKHLYAANEVPDVDVGDDDDAFWRRWLLVEFPNHYAHGEREAGLKRRLAKPEALSGVLNWAIQGRRRLLDQGQFTNEEQYPYEKCQRWRKWGDSVERFLEDVCEQDEDAPRRTTTDAHRVYTAWCREVGEDPVGQRKLTNSLKTEGFGYKPSIRVDGSPTRGYDALGFADEAPDVDDTPERGDEPGQQSLTD